MRGDVPGLAMEKIRREREEPRAWAGGCAAAVTLEGWACCRRHQVGSGGAAVGSP